MGTARKTVHKNDNDSYDDNDKNDDDNDAGDNTDNNDDDNADIIKTMLLKMKSKTSYTKTKTAKTLI